MLGLAKPGGRREISPRASFPGFDGKIAVAQRANAREINGRLSLFSL
jgi:hypothetical protein